MQVFLNLCAWGMSPQEALDAPRVSIGSGYDPTEAVVHVEEGVEEGVVEALRGMGHNVVVVGGFERAMFGRGQVIRVREEGEVRVLSAGSDCRGDGHAVGY